MAKVSTTDSDERRLPWQIGTVYLATTINVRGGRKTKDTILRNKAPFCGWYRR
jgi:hypothetical protein